MLRRPAPTKVPPWGRRFLNALARCGNVRQACRTARVCRKMCYERRRSDPAFDAAWRAALAGAAASLSAGRDGGRPPRGRGILGGAEMEVIGGHGTTPARLIAASPRRWSADKETRFLSMLAATAHVQHAARAAGVTASCCYDQRARRPGFARAWQEAIEIGVLSLESQLISGTLAAVSSDPVIVPADDAPPITDIFGAITLLKWHTRQRGRVMDRPPPPMEDIAPEIERHVRAFMFADARRANPRAKRGDLLAMID